MQEKIKLAIEKALETLGISDVDFSVEHPGDFSHGDYASNVAMVVAKQVGKAPREVAEQLLAALESSKPVEVEKIEIAGPGFINFHLSRKFLSDQVKEILEKKNDWGKNNSLAGKKVMVEYTDPNPFKLLHIGHLMPNALGESIARLFMCAGADVKRVTYQGDVGIHVARTIWRMRDLGVTPQTEFSASDLGKWYAEGTKASEESPEVAAEITKLNKVIYERTDDAVNALYDRGKDVSLKEFEKVYEILGSEFDKNFFESDTGPIGKARVEEHLEIFEKSEGAIIFRGEQYGLHTRVFINKEGLPTYEAKDIGLMEVKYAWWPFDISVTVTGTEQVPYFGVMTKAAEMINPALVGKVELVPNGMLRLPTGKMSSRTGTIVPVLSLVGDVRQKVFDRMGGSDLENKELVAQDVAVSAIKYAILRSAAGKDIIFDIEQSISLEGASGPYLQYTHARIRSILEKAKKEGVGTLTEIIPEKAYDVERVIYQFPEVTERAVREREPHHVATFLTTLAGTFNSWYAKEQIVNKDDEYSPYKVALAEAVAQTLKNGLWCLGIKAPERM
jgi:arginyl-tRNA synthetase